MRAFIFACVIMSVIITIIAIDTVYLNDKIDELYDLLYTAQESGSPTSFGELAGEWRSCRDIFILSVDDDNIDRADDALIAAECALRSNDDGGYYCQLELFKSALQCIRGKYSFTFSNIF